MPNNAQGKDELFAALMKWQKEGVAPEKILVSAGASAAIKRSAPLCPYPRTEVYIGTGDENAAEDYTCR